MVREVPWLNKRSPYQSNRNIPKDKFAMNKLIKTRLGNPPPANAPLLLTLMAGLIVETVAQSSFTRITGGPIARDVPQSYQGVWNDVDGDGFLDLYVLSWSSSVNVLYRNNGDGNFTRSNHASAGNSTITSAWADYDNDGDVDLVVCNAIGANPLFVNDGSGVFTQVSAPPLTTDAAVVSASGSWGDYDADGYLDFFASGATQGGFGPAANYLYHSRGDGSFERVSSGPIVTDQLSSRFSAWGDFDDDGDLDLYVVSGAHENALYWNDGEGNFTAEPSGSIVINDVNNTFGFAWGDYDNDGLLDLFVPHWNDGDHSLHHNDGGGEFSRITGVGIGTDDAYAHGAAWADYDNDGWLDLFVARGASTAQTPARNVNNLLYRNNGDGTFTQITEGDLVNDGGDSACGAWGDYDNDGFVDLFVANSSNLGGPNFLYHNDGNDNGWIKIRCVGRSSNRSAIGTRIRLKARIGGEGFWQLRTIPDGTAATGAPLEAHFGLGDAAIIDTIRVEWPSGIVQELQEEAINQSLVITEPASLSTKEPGQLESRNWAGVPFEIEASEDLIHWTSLGDFSNRDGWFQVEDPDASTFPKRFYRVSTHGARTVNLDGEAAAAALLQSEQAWAAAVAAGDFERVFSFWREDAVIYPVNHPPVRCKSAIRNFVMRNRAMPGFSLIFEPIEAHVSGAGDLGYTVGNFETSFDNPEGIRLVAPERYVDVWRKAADGRWVNVLEIHSPLNPPAPGERTMTDPPATELPSRTWPDPPPNSDVEAERVALLQRDQDVSEAISGGIAIDSILAFFSEDAVMYPAMRPVVEGKPAIRAYFEANRMQPGFSLTTVPFEAQVAASGDLGYTLGTYEFQFDGTNGSPVILPGIYLSAWEKDSNGNWAIVLNAGSPAAASQPATTADIFITAAVTVDADGATVVPVAADPATPLYYRQTGLPVLAQPARRRSPGPK